MNQFLTILDWDSNFFEFNVARFEGSLDNYKDLLILKDNIEKQNIKLTYYSTETKLKEEIVDNDGLEFNLVDLKTTYIKSLGSEKVIYDGVQSYEQGTDDIALKNLALLSGVYSRFYIDKRIPQSKYEDLYTLWIKNSIARVIADEVLIYKIDGLTAGFVTIKLEETSAIIGLIAVHENFRGMGIGTRLLNGAEAWSVSKSCDQIKVITQKNNIPATRLYESSDFQQITLEYYYHIWN